MSESFPKTIGRYELIDRLAVGGMAELFLARSMSASALARPVVIKRLLPHMATDPHFNAMFIDEAKLTNRLAHPNIAGTYEIGRQGDQLYMVMEYVDGIDCLAVLRECAQQKMRLPAEAAVHIAHEVLDALDFAHNEVDDNGDPLDVVHRDISPSNVILSRHGEVKLVDFGIARAARQEHQTKDGTLKGKYGYMSPEQVLEQDLDARSDLFSVGIVLAELLTGRRLFAAHTDLDVLLMVRDVRLTRLDRYGGHIEPCLDRILRKALSKKPDDRFASSAEFRDQLDAWLAKYEPRVDATVIARVVAALYDKVHDRGQEPSANDAVPNAVAEEQGPPLGLTVYEEDEEYVEISHSMPSHSMPGRMDTMDSLPIVSIIVEPERDGNGAGASDDHESGDGVVRAVGSSDELLKVDINDSPTGPTSNRTHIERLATFGWDARDFDDNLVSAVELRPPEATNATDKPPPRPAEDIPDDDGDFATSPPIAVLFRLATTRATGLLIATVGGIRKEVYFRAGIPEYVSSNVNSERFGEYLVNQSVLTPRQLTDALAVMPHHKGKLGDTLVALELLEPLDVFRLLTKQVRHKLIDLCTWARGTFRWYGGRAHPNDSFPLDLNAFEIMGAGAMKLPDVVVRKWLERLPLGCRPHISSNIRIGIEVFHLGAFLAQVYESLQRDSYLAELQLHYRERNERARFVRALYLLAHTRFVTFGD